MPEIKHQFTGGKMNKDLDERLVPNGEYRDAMNIQVATSEGSDVGTVQNILGNIEGCTYASGNPIPSGSSTVGSISDEKNDTLYWFVANNAEVPDYLNTFHKWLEYWKDEITKHRKVTFEVGNGKVIKDLIMRKTPTNCEPVFVDVSSVILESPYAPLTDLPGTFFEGDEMVLNPSSYSNEALAGITPGMLVTGITESGFVSNTVMVDKVVEGQAEVRVELNDKLSLQYYPTLTHSVTAEIEGVAQVKFPDNYTPTGTLITPPISSITGPYWQLQPGDNVSGNNIPAGTTIDEVLYSAFDRKIVLSNLPIISSDSNHIWTSTNLWQTYPQTYTQYPLFNQITVTRPGGVNTEPFKYLCFYKDGVLNFDKHITGVNIIDDMLLWTDNATEPKKINISRSIQGTDPTGMFNTRLVNNYLTPKVNPSNGLDVPIKEEHITVIKKSPKTALTLDLQTIKEPGLNYGGIIRVTHDPFANEHDFLHPTKMLASDVPFNPPQYEQVIGSPGALGPMIYPEDEWNSAVSEDHHDFSALDIGDTFYIKVTMDSAGGTYPSPIHEQGFVKFYDRGVKQWGPGSQFTPATKIVLKEFEEGEPPTLPIEGAFRIKGIIQPWDKFEKHITGNHPAQIAVKIIDIFGEPPTSTPETGQLKYSIDVFHDDLSFLDFHIDINMKMENIQILHHLLR